MLEPSPGARRPSKTIADPPQRGDAHGTAAGSGSSGSSERADFLSLPAPANASRGPSRTLLERGNERVPRRTPMDYNKPTDVVANMIEAGRTKLGLSPRHLLLRGILAGAILATATTLAFGAALSTTQPLVGAIIFPVGLVMIVMLGLELVTGSFALLPLAHLEHGV